MATPLADYGKGLCRQGYPIIPISPGCKFPRMLDWQNIHATESKIDEWIASGRYTGVGVLTGDIVGIDLDIRDEPMVTKTFQWCAENLGPVYPRIGKPPKALLPYRAKTTFRKIKSRVFIGPDGVKHQIEILGTGNQFVAYGIHPETQKPYRWLHEDLASLPVEKLAIITQDQASALIDWFESNIPDDWLTEEYGKVVEDSIQRVADAVEGKRNDTLNREAFHLFGLVKARQLDEEIIRRRLTAAAESCGLEVSEIDATLKSAWQAAEPAKKLEVALDDWEIPSPISDDEWTTAKLAPRCIVEDYLYADVALLAAAGGQGKTTLMLHEAIHIALGMPLYGHEVETPGTVVIITAEDHRERLVARLRAIVEELVLDEGDTRKVCERILISDVTGVPFQLAKQDSTGLNLTSRVDELVKGLKVIKPVLVIMDPYVSFGPGEATVNDGAQSMVLAARAIVKEISCCVRLVHHVGQNSARGKDTDSYAARGGTALPDGCRMVAILTPLEMKDCPLDLHDLMPDSLMRLTLSKLTFAPPQQDIIIARNGYRFTPSQTGLINDAQKTEVRNNEDDQEVHAFLGTELARGRKHTRNTVEASKSTIGISRDRIRAALLRLEMDDRIVEEALPQEERKGGRQVYLAAREW